MRAKICDRCSRIITPELRPKGTMHFLLTDNLARLTPRNRKAIPVDLCAICYVAVSEPAEKKGGRV